MIKEYIAYLRDNPEKYWFKAKVYGWGWAPARIQGWLVLVIFLLLLVWNSSRIEVGSHSGSDVLINFLPTTGLLVIGMLIICYLTGEKPRWQWGIPDKYKKL